MKDRLAVHGMTYGELAIEACTIVGGVFMIVAALASIVASRSGIGTNAWIVLGIPLLAAVVAAIVVWWLGFGSFDLDTAETVIGSILIVGTIALVVVSLLVGVMVIPMGGVPLMWVIFGTLWLVSAAVAVVEAIRDWLLTGPTSVPLDIVAIATTVLALASTGIMVALGMTGLLQGIVLFAGLLGCGVGLGFFAAEEVAEPEEHLATASEARRMHFDQATRA